MGKVSLGPRIRGLFAGCCTALAMLVASSGRTAAGQEISDNTPLEYRVKAAFLLNFARFVEWPSPTGASSPPLVICVLGNDPFGKALNETVAEETVNSRRVEVRRVTPDSPAGCHITFTSDPDAAPPDQRPGLLTVGEGGDFLRKGGVIAFIVENRRVRFDINQRAASSAGIKLSSRLMRVARSVEK